MKKLIALTIATFLCMAGLSFAAARPNGKNGIYYVQGLVGSGAKDLDTLNIDGVGAPNTYDLIEGDAAIYTYLSGTTTLFSIYTFDASSTEATSSPDIIQPDDYNGTTRIGVWLLAKVSASALEISSVADPNFEFNDSNAAGADADDEETVRMLANMSLATEDAEVSDFAFTFMNAGTRQNFFLWDGSEWTLTIGPQTDGWAGGDVANYEQLRIDFDTGTDAEIAVTSPSSATRFDFQIATVVIDALEASGGIDVQGAAGITLQNDETITNAVDDTILLSRDDSGIVTVTAADDDANAALTIVAGGTGKLTLGNSSNADIAIVSDGVDLSETELAILDGVTSSTAQINYLDAADGETGSGSVVFDDTPTLITPVIGAATGTSLALTGALTGHIPILSYSAGEQLTTANNRGVFVIATAAMTLELPDTLVAGEHGCLNAEEADTTIIGLNPGDGNHLVEQDGTVGTNSTTYAATSATGNQICWVCTDADTAYITKTNGTWSE